ncbi:threonylcarbamoyl-AMP synthase [Candidatus Babeliales bacterium]|nr:threonylcarbamoyl-AMP synthase [Candidatus Babeliales bacterium]
MSKIYYKKSNFNKLNWNNKKDLQQLEVSLKNDNVSIVSTDTVYGFLANITEKSFKKIEQLKNKKRQSPFIVLISSKQKLEYFVDLKTISPNLNKLIETCWPGPLTIIFKAKKILPSFLVSRDNTIALRAPKHNGLIYLLKNFDGLFSTSANRAVMPAPTTFEEIEKDLLQKVDLFVDTPEEKKEKLPSTIIDCSKLSKIKIVRTGAYSKKELEKIYGSKI